MSIPDDSPRDATRIVLAAGGETLRRRLEQQLAAAGYSVAPADDLASCIELFRRFRPAAVVVDSALPGGGGVEAARAVSAACESRCVPVLLLYDGEDPVTAVACEAGVAEFADRSSPPGVLEHRLRRALRFDRLVACTAEGGLDLSFDGVRASHAEVCGRDAFLAATADALAKGGAAAVLAIRLSLPRPATKGADEPVVAAVVEAIRASCREVGAPDDASLRVARLARERFALLAPPLQRPADAFTLGTQIYERLSGPLATSVPELRGAASVGVVAAGADEPVGASAMLERAETAAYCARHQGRQRVALYTDGMSRWAPGRQLLERSLRDAVARNELVLYWQPRLHAATRRVVGMEALVRWVHPDWGVVSPARFIPMAEESGLIAPIGEWVLREACRQGREWQDMGLAPVRLSVNLSAIQFRRPELFDEVKRTLADARLDPRRLELELTESMLMSDPKVAIETLRRFKDAGIHLSIDDFGTGYSSLGYLRRFPIDALKIDQSFVREVTSRPEDAAIATAIILLGHSLKLDVIAEGVETESQLSFLQVLQCDEVQGFLFSRPVPAEQAQAFLGAAAAAQPIPVAR